MWSKWTVSTVPVWTCYQTKRTFFIWWMRGRLNKKEYLVHSSCNKSSELGSIAVARQLNTTVKDIALYTRRKKEVLNFTLSLITRILPATENDRLPYKFHQIFNFFLTHASKNLIRHFKRLWDFHLPWQKVYDRQHSMQIHHCIVSTHCKRWHNHVVFIERTRWVGSNRKPKISATNSHCILGSV